MNKFNIELDGAFLEVDHDFQLMEYLAQEKKMECLCYHPKVEGHRNCGLCVVEVDGSKGEQRTLKGACSVVLHEGQRIWTTSQKIESYRRSVISLYLSQLPLNGFLNSAKLRRLFQGLVRNIGFGAQLPLPQKETALEKEKFNRKLSFTSSLCIGCGLCVDLEKMYEEHPALKLILKEGLFSIEKSKELSEKFTKALALICPTDALQSQVPNEMATEVLPRNHRWEIRVGEDRLQCQTRDGVLHLNTTKYDPLVPDQAFSCLDRYQTSVAFYCTSIKEADWSKKTLEWCLGENLDADLLSDLKQLAYRRRERLFHLNDLNKTYDNASSHPLAKHQMGGQAAVILGPDDFFDENKWKKIVAKTGQNPALVMLSRYDQLKGIKMEQWPETIWAPCADILEFGVDMRFPRHHLNLWRRLHL